jgi:hypothetical protein
MKAAQYFCRCQGVGFLVLLTLVALSIGVVPGAYAQTPQNLVYVMSNITATGQNSVQGFVNDGLGNLTPLSGSPYATGGTGVGPASDGTDFQWDSDQEIMVNAAGTLLFSVNGHSNDITEFTINADGSLAKLSSFASGGQGPASIGYKDNALPGKALMVVVNKNSDPNQTGGVPNYTTFFVDSAGTVTQNLGSTFNLTAGSSPAQAMMRPGARIQFFGVEFLNNKMVTYKVSPQGALTEVSESTPPVTSPMVLGGVMHPNLKGFYVALPIQHQIAVYKYDISGNLLFQRTVVNKGAAVCWLATDAAGTRLYSAETPSHTWSVYDLTNPLNPVQLQHKALVAGGAQPAHMKADPTGKFMYIVDRKGFLHTLDILADGTLADVHPLTGLNLPAGTVPLGLAVLMK